MTTNTIQKAAGATNTNGLNTHTNVADFRTEEAMVQVQDDKAIVTRTVQLELAGHIVHRLIGCGYLVSKWGYTYHAKDFVALQVFANSLGICK